MNKPPFTSQVAPVVKAASGEASWTTMPATKAGSPMSPTGMAVFSSARRSAGTVRWTMGRSSGPGAMALTVTPDLPRSRAKTFVSVMMAPLEDA